MIKSYVVNALLFSFLLIFSGCLITGSGSKDHMSHDKVQVYEKQILPPWQAQQEHQGEHVYNYFPSNGIYYSIGTAYYFYYLDDRWTESASIPVAVLSANIDNYVTIKMDTDKPYTYHDEVKSKYPPEQTKKKEQVKI